MAIIDLIIFDFDGTLVDTAPDLIRSTNLYLKSKGFAALSEEEIRFGIGMGLGQLILKSWPNSEKLDKARRARIENEFVAVYEKEFLKSPTLYPGVIEFLAVWDGQIAIVSNKRVRFIKPILEKLEIEALPWVRIIGGDSLTHMKPHPEPFLAAINAAGVTPEETVVIGDGAPDVEGAMAVGCQCLAVEFGYTPALELVKLGAWGSLSGFDQLSSALADLNAAKYDEAGGVER